MTSPRIVIVGGGPAGTFAAIAAKKQNADAAVTLVNDEACEPYEKPPLSKAFLLGRMVPDDARIAGPAGVRSHGVALECDACAIAIDRATSEVVLVRGLRPAGPPLHARSRGPQAPLRSRGSLAVARSSFSFRLPYDALVIATGASARELPQLPFGLRGVHYLRTEADAQRLKAELAPGRRLLIIGGGLIGLEVAASAAELGIRTTVLEVESRVLARVCDEETGAIVHAAHLGRGVDIRLNTALAAAWPQPDGCIEARTSAGDDLVADLVVVGIGSKPHDRLAVEAGLVVDDGIVVDEYCRTSDPRIFAAGDVVRFPGPRGLVRLENWRHALEQGSVAGRNAAGAADVYAPVPSFWSEQYDLYVQGVGWQILGAERVRRPTPGNAALMFEVHGGRLQYAMGINAQRDLATARRLIERRIPVDAARLADPSQPLAAILKRGS